MAQNVKIAGASYNSVPSIQIPKVAGGYATFVDTSDANATAPDIQIGKVAYVGGFKVIGTGTGGGSQVTVEPLSVTANGTYNAPEGVAYSPVTVNIPETVVKNVQGYHGMASIRVASYTATGVKLTVSKSGTYKVSWIGIRNTNYGTSGTQLYIAGQAYGSASTTFTQTYAQAITLTNVRLQAGQTVEVYARARNPSYYMMAGNLIIEEQ